MDNAFRYLVSKGSESESDYPYTAQSSFVCKYDSSKVVFKIAGYKDVRSNSVDQLESAVAQQPVPLPSKLTNNHGNSTMVVLSPATVDNNSTTVSWLPVTTTDPPLTGSLRTPGEPTGESKVTSESLRALPTSVVSSPNPLSPPLDQ